MTFERAVIANVIESHPLTPVRVPGGRGASSRLVNYVWATAGVLLVLTGCAVTNPYSLHWFVVPVAVCGILTGADVVAWLRGELDTFDPKAIVGLLWFHGTFLAPLLHVVFEVNAEFFDSQVQDWRKWFGLMGLLTAGGLLLYKSSQQWFFRRSRPTRTFWTLHDGRFLGALAGAVALSAVAAAVIFVKFGGLQKGASPVWGGGERIHLSWLMMLGDPLPLLIAVGVIRVLSARRRDRSLVTAGILLSLLLVAQFFLLGLRGSRSAVINVVFLATALCHYRLRRIGVMWVLIGAFGLGVAGYQYKFFKRFGSVGLEALGSPEFRRTLSHRGGISPLSALLGDLSRAEIQTFLLYRLTEHGDDYRLRWGQTYVFAGLMFIPRAIWPDKPSDVYGKVAAGTDLQYGQGTFVPRRFRSLRVYGLAGEAMLNFGVPGALLGYVVYGAFLGWYRRKIVTLHSEDARFFLVPIFTAVAFIAVFGDADNTTFFFLKNGVMLVAVVLLSSTRVPLLGDAVRELGRRPPPRRLHVTRR